MKHPLAALLATLALAATGLAQVPEEITLQGRLETSGGSAITDPTTVTFRIFDAAVGGTEIAAETDLVVPDSDGVFATTFGDQAGLDPGTFAQDLWFEFEVESEGPMGTRLPLTPAPSALVAAQLAMRNRVSVSHTGNDTESGAYLQDAVAQSQGTTQDPAIVVVGPGTFDLDGGSLQMKEHVTVLGAGSELTTIRSTGFGNTSTATITFTGLEFAQLRGVSVGSFGTGNAVALFLDDASPKILDVVARASGGSVNIAAKVVSTSGEPEPTFFGCELLASAEGSATAQGILLSGANIDPSIEQCLVEASGEASSSGTLEGLRSDSGAGVYMVDSTIEVAREGTGGTAIAVNLVGPADSLLRNCEMYAEADSGVVTGLAVAGGTNTPVVVGSMVTVNETGSATSTGISLTSNAGGGGGQTVRLRGVSVDGLVDSGLATSGSSTDVTATNSDIAGGTFSVNCGGGNCRLSNVALVGNRNGSGFTCYAVSKNGGGNIDPTICP